jgi:phage baseplate assembly protein W
MATISFKNVGELVVDRNSRRTIKNAEKIPLGIVTPVRAGDESDGIFKMHRDLGDQIQDNFRNLLLTNRGDRVVQYNFGADLMPLTFELTSHENFDIEAMLRIKAATERWMPFIVLKDFESKIEHSTDKQPVGRITIDVTYDVPRAGITDKKITVVLFVGG